MDQIPPELVRYIYGHLLHEDISNLRLVCKNFAEIGLHFLPTEVHLLLTPGGFKRILAAPENPQICARIRSFFFEADQLLYRHKWPLSREQWSAYVPITPEPDYMSIVTSENPGFSSRDARCQIRSIRKDWTVARERTRAESYARYTHYVARQIELLQDLQWSNKFYSLLCLLPNLASVTVSTNATMRPYTGMFGSSP